MTVNQTCFGASEYDWASSPHNQVALVVEASDTSAGIGGVRFDGPPSGPLNSRVLVSFRPSVDLAAKITPRRLRSMPYRREFAGVSPVRIGCRWRKVPHDLPADRRCRRDLEGRCNLPLRSLPLCHRGDQFLRRDFDLFLGGGGRSFDHRVVWALGCSCARSG